MSNPFKSLAKGLKKGAKSVGKTGKKIGKSVGKGSVGFGKGVGRAGKFTVKSAKGARKLTLKGAKGIVKGANVATNKTFKVAGKGLNFGLKHGIKAAFLPAKLGLKANVIGLKAAAGLTKKVGKLGFSLGKTAGSGVRSGVLGVGKGVLNVGRAGANLGFQTVKASLMPTLGAGAGLIGFGKGGGGGGGGGEQYEALPPVNWEQGPLPESQYGDDEGGYAVNPGEGASAYESYDEGPAYSPAPERISQGASSFASGGGGYDDGGGVYQGGGDGGYSDDGSAAIYGGDDGGSYGGGGGGAGFVMAEQAQEDPAAAYSDEYLPEEPQGEGEIDPDFAEDAASWAATAEGGNGYDFGDEDVADIGDYLAGFADAGVDVGDIAGEGWKNAMWDAGKAAGGVGLNLLANKLGVSGGGGRPSAPQVVYVPAPEEEKILGLKKSHALALGASAAALGLYSMSRR